jgi:hypothetical protein
MPGDARPQDREILPAETGLSMTQTGLIVKRQTLSIGERTTKGAF